MKLVYKIGRGNFLESFIVGIIGGAFVGIVMTIILPLLCIVFGTMVFLFGITGFLKRDK
jgi:hypothetical protein